MTSYLRARHVPLLASVVLVSLVTLALSGQLVLTTPGLLGGGDSQLLLGALLPIPIVLAGAYGLAMRERPVEVISVRPVAVLDLALLASVVAVPSVLVVLCGLTHSIPPSGVIFTRNLVLLVGILAGAAGLGYAVAGGFVALVLLVTTTSYGPYNRAARFVRVLQNDASDTWSWIVASATFTTGMALLLTGRSLLRLVRPGYVPMSTN